jgi:hypothetical protein
MVEIPSRHVDLDFYTPVRKRGAVAETSIDGLPQMEQHMSLKQKAIYDVLCLYGPCTLFEIAHFTGFPINCCTEPLTRLRANHMVVAGPLKVNPTGCSAQSWLTAERAKLAATGTRT